VKYHPGVDSGAELRESKTVGIGHAAEDHPQLNSENITCIDYRRTWHHLVNLV
jgi:hypothetical protein